MCERVCVCVTERVRESVCEGERENVRETRLAYHEEMTWPRE